MASAKGKTCSPAEAVRRRALEMGAAGAKIISPKRVFTAAWVRWKCRYRVRRLRLEPALSAAFADAGRDARSARRLPPRDPHSRRREDGHAPHGRRAGTGGLPRRVLQGVRLRLRPVRTLRGMRIRQRLPPSELARPAMEACGIDVFRTARTAGFPIEVATEPLLAAELLWLAASGMNWSEKTSEEARAEKRGPRQ